MDQYWCYLLETKLQNMIQLYIMDDSKPRKKVMVMFWHKPCI